MVLSKQQLIGSLQNEIRILVHLCGKLKPEMLDYRPTAKQRSTLELLRYLTVMGPVLVPSCKAGQFLVDKWNELDARAKELDFDAVVKDLTAQAAFYQETLEAWTDEDFQAEVEMFGRKTARGPFLVNMVVSGHAAYRTQLFLYLKACGREELGTMNLWGGMDAPAAAS
jgi:hypothetical protein